MAIPHQKVATDGLFSYEEPKSLTDQSNFLRELFPGLGAVNQDLLGRIERGEVECPVDAEGWFVAPNWIKNSQLFGKTYSEAVEEVLATLSKTRKGKFYNHHNGKLGRGRLRQSERTIRFLGQLSKDQGNPDILIFPAQFGLRHRGRSVYRVRETMGFVEFGLGAFAVGSVLLTHPDCLKTYTGKPIDCAGDEYVRDGDHRFWAAPRFFLHDDDELRFWSRWIDCGTAGCGSASGFMFSQ